MSDPDNARHAARLVLVEGAVLALLRECGEVEDGPDAINIRAYTTFDNRVEIDVEYLTNNLPLAGESL